MTPPVSKTASPAAHEEDPKEALFAGLFGLFLGLALLKFGNPVILDHLVDTPKNLEEWRAFAWPVRFGYLGLGLVTAIGLWLVGTDWRARGPKVLLGLALAWLTWQFAATIGSVDPASSRVILPHLASCVLCLVLGHFALSRVREPRVFWICLVAGFIGVLGMAADQRLGGLEATRKAILENAPSNKLPPEYLARIQSNRVWGTLVYPNALAGAILLLTPLSAVLLGRLGARRSPLASRGFAATAVVAGALVLVWSGSKAGWLLALGSGIFALFHARLPWRMPVRAMIAAVALLVGLAGFKWAFAEKLSRGATSVSARFDYWRAAWQGFQERPIMGNGPGSFRRIYAQRKRPESEMAQLAHNDYLQQATDSGLPGFLAYAAFVTGSLGYLYRQRSRIPDALAQATWLGLAAWFAHGLLEFGLYLPATAWTAFALLGWVLAQKPSPTSPSSLT